MGGYADKTNFTRGFGFPEGAHRAVFAESRNQIGNGLDVMELIKIYAVGSEIFKRDLYVGFHFRVARGGSFRREEKVFSEVAESVADEFLRN